MDVTTTRFINDLIARLDGPLHFRILLQPIMAIVLAVRDGLRDERIGAPPYSWTLLTDADLRPTLIRNGFKSIGRIFALAIVLDAIYQIIFLRRFYPFETLFVAALLALLPYVMSRGIVNRVKRALESRTGTGSSAVSDVEGDRQEKS